jgi:hypothetical protein
LLVAALVVVEAVVAVVLAVSVQLLTIQAV